MNNDEWRLFRGRGAARTETPAWPAPPPWRTFAAPQAQRPFHYLIGPDEADVVNAALHLHRPLLVTGKPGTGKSSLAEAVARELVLGQVLRWPVNSRTTLTDGLYRYDAIARLRDSNQPGAEPEIGEYIQLGPLGTALATSEAGRPRVLLVDELDKSDVDLPNDLLTAFEEGWFEIPELARLKGREEGVPVRVLGAPNERYTVTDGYVRCTQFPVVVITSNGERDFPPAFLRRCVRLELKQPPRAELLDILAAHLGPEVTEDEQALDLLRDFLTARDDEQQELATDQLLNAVQLRLHEVDLNRERLRSTVLRPLDDAGTAYE